MEINEATKIVNNFKNLLSKSNDNYKALEVLIKFAEESNKMALCNYTWSEIAEISKSGKAKEFFNLGDTKFDHMKNGDAIEYRIIGFNHDVENSITFEATKVYKNMEFSDEVCTYKKSNIYKYLHNDFLSVVSDDLRRNVKNVEKIDSYDGFSSISNNYFFILSEQEVFGRKIFSYGHEGKWYDYYKQEDVSYKLDDVRWLRSRYCDTSYSYRVCFVNSTGSAGIGSYYYSRGLVPAFCI